MIVDAHQHFWSGSIAVITGGCHPILGPLLRLLARQFSCKISGLITEAQHNRWTPTDLDPFVQHVFEIFGEDRVMFGSDWPVCLLAGSYAEALNGIRTILDHKWRPPAWSKCTVETLSIFTT